MWGRQLATPPPRTALSTEQMATMRTRLAEEAPPPQTWEAALARAHDLLTEVAGDGVAADLVECERWARRGVEALLDRQVPPASPPAPFGDPRASLEVRNFRPDLLA